jgi:hypothetical protein
MASRFETRLKKKFEADGWKVYTKGWPDFLLVKKDADGRVILRGVEAKSEKDQLRSDQLAVLKALASVMTVRIAKEGSGYGRDGGDAHGDFFFEMCPEMMGE